MRVFLRTDEEIGREVREEVLDLALGLPAGSVTVSVGDGMVTLAGVVPHHSDIPTAIRLTYRVDGVVGVVNSLTFRADDTPSSGMPHD